MSRVTIISSHEDGVFFFSTDHCQKHGLGENFVPVSYNLPMSCVPRKGLESGIIRTIKDLVFILYFDLKEIPNPNPNFQPIFVN